MLLSGREGSGQQGGIPALEWEEGRRLAATGAACARGAGRREGQVRPLGRGEGGQVHPLACFLVLVSDNRQQLGEIIGQGGGHKSVKHSERFFFDTLQTKFLETYKFCVVSQV